MNRTKLLSACVISLGLLLAGCGSSPPNRYYVLSAHEFSAPGANSVSLGVGPIETPEYLGRENLVLNSAKNSLEVSGEALWAEPLDDGIQRVLVLNLAGLLKTQDVGYFPWHPKRAPNYGIKVNLLQLDANAQEARLTAEWLVYRPSDSASINRKISQLQVPMATGGAVAEHTAQAYSSLLFQLSEIIAAAITTDMEGKQE